MACERYRRSASGRGGGRAGPGRPRGAPRLVRGVPGGARGAAAGAGRGRRGDGRPARRRAVARSWPLASARRWRASRSLRRAWRFGWLWPATAAAATLLVALAVLLGRGTPSAPEPRVAVDARRPQSAGSTRAAEPGAVVPVDRPARRQACHRSAGRRWQASSPRGAPVRPGDEGSAVPADPSGPGRPESLGMTGRPSPRSSSRPARPRRCCASSRSCTASAWRRHSLARGGSALGRPRGAGAIDIQPLEIVPLDPAETSGTVREGDRSWHVARSSRSPSLSLWLALGSAGAPRRRRSRRPRRPGDAEPTTPPRKAAGRDPARPARDHPLPGREEAGQPALHVRWSTDGRQPGAHADGRRHADPRDVVRHVGRRRSEPTSFQYRNVGTNIDCSARRPSGTAATSSASASRTRRAPQPGAPAGGVDGRPALPPLRHQPRPVLRDGQSVQTVARPTPSPARS